MRWAKESPRAVESAMNTFDKATAAGKNDYARAALQDAATAAEAITNAGGTVDPDVQARLDAASGS